MSQPDDLLNREPDLSCDACGGTGLCGCDECAGLPVPAHACEWCHVAAHVETPAELRERVRFTDRLLSEPGYQMAVVHLLLQKLSLTAGSHPATPASEPANRPASTSGVSLSLTGENPGPAGLSGLVGIAREKAA